MKRRELLRNAAALVGMGVLGKAVDAVSAPPEVTSAVLHVIKKPRLRFASYRGGSESVSYDRAPLSTQYGGSALFESPEHEAAFLSGTAPFPIVYGGASGCVDEYVRFVYMPWVEQRKVAGVDRNGYLVTA